MFKDVGSLTESETYLFRVTATNKYGQAASASPEFSYKATTVPEAPTVSSIEKSGSFIKITWSGPTDDNGETVTAYQVVVREDDSTTDFHEDTTNCNAQESSIVTNKFCLIPYSALTASPYNLDVQDTITVKVRAQNSRGWGAYSAISTSSITVESVPNAMADPTSGSATSSSQIQVDWVALSSPANGDSAIISYVLYWDQGSNDFEELVGDTSAYTATNYIKTGLTAATTYKFKVAAKNEHGTGAFSSEVSIVAESVPSQMSTVVTSTDSANGNLIISFAEPSSNGGKAITAYTIKVLQHGTSSTYNTMTSCDGSDSTIMLNTQCSVPMTELVTDHSYTLDSLIVVIASATNSLGEGAYSNPNTSGATTSTLPQ